MDAWLWGQGWGIEPRTAGRVAGKGRRRPDDWRAPLPGVGAAGSSRGARVRQGRGALARAVKRTGPKDAKRRWPKAKSDSDNGHKHSHTQHALSHTLRL